jgi:hypothetical protein
MFSQIISLLFISLSNIYREFLFHFAISGNTIYFVYRLQQYKQDQRDMHEFSSAYLSLQLNILFVEDIFAHNKAKIIEKCEIHPHRFDIIRTQTCPDFP